MRLPRRFPALAIALPRNFFSRPRSPSRAHAAKSLLPCSCSALAPPQVPRHRSSPAAQYVARAVPAPAPPLVPSRPVPLTPCAFLLGAHMCLAPLPRRHPPPPPVPAPHETPG
ncbi:hypothetical protein ACP4OV_030095 [Aristida adscensionis]